MSRARNEVGLYGADAPADRQRAAFTGGDVPVAVYGLGKMGLPLAAVYAHVCGNVVGADVDEDVVETVNRGDCHVEREPGLDELVADVVAAGAMRATADPAEAAERARVHVAIVPTLLDGDDPDLSSLEAVVSSVAEGLEPGDLVIVESTVPPGTCEEVVAPTLAECSGVDADEFGVAFCPERTSSGRALRDVRGAYPKVVGGVDGESARAAELVYDELVDNEVVTVSDATTAECVKLFEGLYRDVNVALANQLALLADDLGVDVVEAKEVANSQPFCEVHDPGAGVGGHCIPVYPYFVMDRASGQVPLLRIARAVNDGMPAHTVELVRRALAAEGRTVEDSTVLVLGVTYRPGVAETRNAPALGVIDGLAERGADVLAADPMVDDPEVLAPAESVPLPEVYAADPDAVVVVTAHEEFEALDPDGFDDAVVVDGRRLFDPSRADGEVYVLGDGRRLPPADDAAVAEADRAADEVAVADGDGATDDATVADGGVGDGRERDGAGDVPERGGQPGDERPGVDPP